MSHHKYNVKKKKENKSTASNSGCNYKNTLFYISRIKQISIFDSVRSKLKNDQAIPKFLITLIRSCKQKLFLTDKM
jgi:hypothetical protein